ncbi:ABC transporter ATP-binding protein [Lactococcus cremoris]|uniref:ABC transporter ATP-binding protein n=1 Tax=Lactococcus lactis subsp. cremoris TaxID=1359 RepID=UPI00038B19D7|nr:ABC transporter ATP-binding protein [Lactococcus cremoris]EQC90398.1 ABC transporter ATP-binding protein [Lactococcus cremoris subsp. cremoris TIFN7]MCT0497963.1 ABC transporter ATP-binding protein [Lactococcus cremoris]
MTSPITVKGMSVKFGDKIILDRLSYDFESGKIICLIGPSGSGKSTFIKSIVGMQKLDSGSVEILEVKIPDRKILGQLGYMAQEDALFKELTGKQNLEFFGSLQGIKKNELTEKLEKTALTVNLTSHLKQSVANYSGGMQRRLSLAIALQTDAPILLLDEPTVGIDPELRQEIWEELRNQADQGKTILITTHVMDEAERCDIVLMLRNGKFIDEGSPKEIKEKYQVDSVEEAFIVAGKTLEMKAKEVVR